MRRLLNAIIAISIVTITILVVLPLVTGYWLKNHYQQILNKLVTPYPIQLTVTHFKRGWWAAHASLLITIPHHDQRITLPIYQNIFYGPFITRKIHDKYQIKLAFAEIQSICHSPLLNFKSLVSMTFNKKIYHQLKIGNISFIDNNLRIFLTHLTSQSVYEINTHLVKNRIHVDKAIIQKQNREMIHLENILLDSQLKNTARVNIENRIRVQKFSNKTLNLESLDLNMVFNNMDLRAILHFMKILYHSHAYETDHSTSLYDGFMNLLAHGFSAYIQVINIGTSEGILKADLQAHFKDQRLKNSLPYLLSHAEGTTRIEVPRKWLIHLISDYYRRKNPVQDRLNPEDASNQLIEKWINHKKLILDKENVKMNILWNKGVLLINGFPP